MEGEARFTGQAPDLAYHEAGDLRLGTGPVLRAERRYHWHFGEGRVTVRFEDGRAFHAFPLTAEREQGHQGFDRVMARHPSEQVLKESDRLFRRKTCLDLKGGEDFPVDEGARAHGDGCREDHR